MVIASARTKYSRVYDSFSRDRSTPKADTYFGAMNSLTAAIGKEENGVTTILFRRKLKGKFILNFPKDIHVLRAIPTKQ